jgi:uncharacterized protein (TIGR00661 family)
MIKKVLIAPLDWGLGHATRCIPVIRELMEQDIEVIIGSDGEIRTLLTKEFPQLKHISLKGYQIKYSSFLPIWVVILLQVPKIIFRIISEHHWLKKVIEVENIDAIISDNRFGLWNRKIKSVYITHQILIKAPLWFRWIELILHRLHKFFITKYTICWIPDYEGEKNLSGDLSHRYHIYNAVYIGPLSRFSYSIPNNYKYEVAAILSGPEPHRSSFEKIITKQLKAHSIKSILVKGRPEEAGTDVNGTLESVAYLSSSELQNVIAESKLVICRAGYSSIMDLARLKKNAVLVPTPGQTEQEYLANELMNKGIFYSVAQKKFELQRATSHSQKYSVEKLPGTDTSPDLLKQAIKNLKESE